MKNRKFIIIAFAVLLMTAMLSMSACNRNQEPAVQPTEPVLAAQRALDCGYMRSGSSLRSSAGQQMQ